MTFVQTVCDYPLVKAIIQNVVKHPILPDFASRVKLIERKSAEYTEKYADYIHFGVEEWRKVYPEHEKLRKQANLIDTWDSPYKAIISALMLKEGWDVCNVTTIVGLRAYASKSNILPEQTLGRGLRRMYAGADTTEYVSVVGTEPFVDFVESIKNEGVELERKPMGAGTAAHAPIIIEVDNENVKKDIDALDIEIPILVPLIYREYKRLEDLALDAFGHKKIEYKQFSEVEMREIIFKDITTGEIDHVTYLDSAGIGDYRSVIGYFAQMIMRELCLVSGYDVLCGKVKEFIRDHLFTTPVELDDLNTIRNLSEL